MDDAGYRLDSLDVELLDRFTQSFSMGIPGRSMLLGRMPVLRRFFFDPDSSSPRKSNSEMNVCVGLELDLWCGWLREQRGMSEGVIRNRRGWVAGFVTGLVCVLMPVEN